MLQFMPHYYPIRRSSCRSCAHRHQRGDGDLGGEGDRAARCGRHHRSVVDDADRADAARHIAVEAAQRAVHAIFVLRIAGAVRRAPTPDIGAIANPLVRIVGAIGALRERRATAILEIVDRSEEHTSELQSLMRISYAVFCLKKKTNTRKKITTN